MNNRLKKLQSEIKFQKLDAALISKVANIIYLTNYSGFSNEEREAFLLITPKSQYLFTDGRYSDAVKKLIPDFQLVEISSKNKLNDLLAELIKKHKIQKLGVEENDLKVTEYKTLKKILKNLIDFKFHEHRAVKTSEEINLITKACEIGDKAFDYVIKKIKPEITEKQLMFFLDRFIREQGFEPSFKTIVAFGENSAVPHHQSGERKLKKGDFVLLDFGVKFKNYCSDMTRTLVFAKPSQKQLLIYETVKQAQQKTYEYLNQKIKQQSVISAKAGIRAKPAGVLISSQREGVLSGMTNEIKASDIDKVARDHILKSGFPTIPHSLGHGIGVEVHEHPYLGVNNKEVLKEGMVFSIEPGIYIADFGGVRIEDLYVIEKSGVRQLTTSPKELICI